MTETECRTHPRLRYAAGEKRSLQALTARRDACRLEKIKRRRRPTRESAAAISASSKERSLFAKRTGVDPSSRSAKKPIIRGGKINCWCVSVLTAPHWICLSVFGNERALFFC
jgi:hypothetical protein